jgi:hypothetical protein
MPEITSSSQLLLPVLHYLGDGKIHTPEEIRSRVSILVKDGQRKGGNNCTRLHIWVAFALKNFQRAMVISKVGPHEYRINQRGRELLARQLPQINIETLKQYPEMRQSLHEAAMKAVESRFGKSNCAKQYRP